MGTFQGHVLPGSLFIALGVWWWLHILAIIAKAQTRFSKHRGKQRPNTLEFHLDFVSTTWQKVTVPYLGTVPVEPSLKVIGTTIGIIEGLVAADWRLTDKHNNFSHLDNFAHSSMYAIFLLGGVVEILRFYSVLFLPAAADHVLASLAFFVTGGLFYFHIDGRPVLDQRLHILICVSAFVISVILLLEAWQRKSFLLFMARTILVVVMGTWFIQIAHVLYGTHPWKDTAPNQEFVIIAFSWHIIGWLLTFLCSLVILSVFVRLRRRSPCVISLAANENVSRDAPELDELMITEQADDGLSPVDQNLEVFGKGAFK